MNLKIHHTIKLEHGCKFSERITLTIKSWFDAKTNWSFCHIGFRWSINELLIRCFLQQIERLKRILDFALRKICRKGFVLLSLICLGCLLLLQQSETEVKNFVEFIRNIFTWLSILCGYDTRALNAIRYQNSPLFHYEGK